MQVYPPTSTMCVCALYRGCKQHFEIKGHKMYFQSYLPYTSQIFTCFKSKIQSFAKTVMSLDGYMYVLYNVHLQNQNDNFHKLSDKLFFSS